MFSLYKSNNRLADDMETKKESSYNFVNENSIKYKSYDGEKLKSLENSSEVYEDEQYYKLVREGKEIILTVFNEDNVLFYSKYTRNAPAVFPINSDENVICVVENVGNPSPKYMSFYDVINNIKSDVFLDAELLNYEYDHGEDSESSNMNNGKRYNDNIVYYIDYIRDENGDPSKCKKKLILRDIFDKNKFYKEIERDFSGFITLYSINDIKMIDNILYLSYYKGEDYELISETIDLGHL